MTKLLAQVKDQGVSLVGSNRPLAGVDEEGVGDRSLELVQRMKLPGTTLGPAGFTVEGANPGLLSELLDAYDHELKTRSRPVWDAFVRGDR